MGFVEAVELGGEGSASSCAVVVRSVDEHDWGRCFADCRQQALAEFGRAFPGIGSSPESNDSADGAVTLGGEQCELATERVPCDGDALSVDSAHSFQEGQSGSDIVELIRGHENELQVLPSFISLKQELIEEAVQNA
jgi:hypothetical protein